MNEPELGCGEASAALSRADCGEISRADGFDPTMLIELPEDRHMAEALWRLTKRILCFAVDERGTCNDCDLLRAIAHELLRIRAECRGRAVPLEDEESVTVEARDELARLRRQAGVDRLRQKPEASGTQGPHRETRDGHGTYTWPLDRTADGTSATE